METQDLKITIKNIPSDALKKVWDGAVLFSKEHNEIVESTNNIVIEFGLMQPKSFYEILASAMTEHCLAAAQKIKGVA